MGKRSPGSMQGSWQVPSERQDSVCPRAPLSTLYHQQVKSVSHDLEQLHRLLQVARSLVRNPHLCLGPYVRSLVGSVLYCVLEPLAASINPLNDHWTLRDGAALLLSHIFWYHRG